jgi:PAS domain S-box-containing protein
MTGDAERGGWQLADHLGDMISAHAPDGTYRYASAAAHRLLGYEPDELVGTDAYEYFHPDDIAKVAAAHRSALAGRPFAVTYRLRRKDGVYIWVETTTSVVTDASGELVTELVAATRAIDAREAGVELADGDLSSELERIEKVLESGEIVPVFQPIFELETMDVVAFEALARFPGDPALTPDRWFADAWRVGLGITLELLAAKLATAAFARLGARVTLFVNASPPVVAAPGFLQTIAEAGGQVTVEVTEHLKVDDYHQLGLELAAFRAAGGQLAIDDFGAGFASFRHILELRPQWIKLDGALIRQLGTSEFARGLAHAVVSFARDSGVEVIAEGIETEAELGQVAALGIRHGQGFLLSKPLSLEEALAVAES